MRIGELNSVLTGDGVFLHMRLIMFDIDGTLTDRMNVDVPCFVRAFAEVCGFGDIGTVEKETTG